MEPNMNKDWVQNLKFNLILEKNFSHVKERAWRYFLLKYSFKYYDVYHTDWLDEAFIYLEAELENSKNRVLLKSELSKIKKEIVYTKGEYSWSLSSIAEAVERLLCEEPLTRSCVKKIINLILFAYSCHMDETKFLKEEDNLLCSWFEKLKMAKGIVYLKT